MDDTEDHGAPSKSAADYRGTLQGLEQKMQDQSDKSLLTLSSGALGLSLLFLKDVIGGKPVIHGGFLVAAWACWAASLISTLVSYSTSAAAMRAMVDQVDNDKLKFNRTVKRHNFTTTALNLTSLISFILGAISLLAFFVFNIN